MKKLGLVLLMVTLAVIILAGVPTFRPAPPAPPAPQDTTALKVAADKSLVKIDMLEAVTREHIRECRANLKGNDFARCATSALDAMTEPLNQIDREMAMIGWRELQKQKHFEVDATGYPLFCKMEQPSLEQSDALRWFQERGICP